MDKAKLKELRDKIERNPGWETGVEMTSDLNNRFLCIINALLDEPTPEPHPIPVRTCEVCGTACGVEVCDACRMDATTFWVGVTTAQGRYLSGEHTDSPDIEGYEHAYADAKRGYLRRIEKRRQSK